MRCIFLHQPSSYKICGFQIFEIIRDAKFGNLEKQICFWCSKCFPICCSKNIARESFRKLTKTLRKHSELFPNSSGTAKRNGAVSSPWVCQMFDLRLHIFDFVWITSGKVPTKPNNAFVTTRAVLDSFGNFYLNQIVILRFWFFEILFFRFRKITQFSVFGSSN